VTDSAHPYEAKYGSAGPSSRPRQSRVTRLLVIDDEPLMGLVMRRIFGRSHDVMVVERGRDALALFEAGVDPDVVLCDVVMPELGGIEVYEAARARYPRIAARFVFITGGTLLEKNRAFLASIPNPVLPKPFELDAVREAVRRMLLFRA
jgi:CheY-like chemotaxis protein